MRELNPDKTENFLPGDVYVNLYTCGLVARLFGDLQTARAHRAGAEGITVRISRDPRGDFYTTKAEEF